ncbi:MAG: cytochrome c biogenesis protein CcdA [Paracoccaceae bacterium]
MFGIDIFTAALLPSMLVALVAGLVSFLSPCVLPVVPAYLSYMTGASLDDMGARRGRALLTATFFVLGLSTVFLLLAIGATALAGSIAGFREWFPIVSGLIVMLFGLHFLGIIRIGFLNREARFDAGDRGGTPFGAYVLGLAFSLGWAPCIGPILSTVLALVAQDQSMSRGMVLMGTYAFGLGIPFLLFALFFGASRRMMKMMLRHMEKIERVAGLLLWTIGLMLLTDQFTRISFWLLEVFPALQNIG